MLVGLDTQHRTVGLNKMIEIKQGDCLELFKGIKDDSVDLIIADPPYNLGKDYGNKSDSREFDEYLEFSKKWLSEADRVLRKDGTIYVFMGVRFISYIYDLLQRQFEYKLNSWITWHYTQGIGRTKGFSPRHEDILMFNKSDKFTFNLDSVRIPQKFYRSRNNMNGANPGDVWEFSHVHYCNENRQDHPTQKPEGLIERMVLASSNEKALILDPFAGSGTTLRVAQQLNRSCIGFELNPDYVKMIEERLKSKFLGFDSVDPRSERVPRDLNDTTVREKYLAFHKEKFLKNHERSIPKFEKEVFRMYSHKQNLSASVGQLNFLDEEMLDGDLS